MEVENIFLFQFDVVPNVEMNVWKPNIGISEMMQTREENTLKLLGLLLRENISDLLPRRGSPISYPSPVSTLIYSHNAGTDQTNNKINWEWAGLRSSEINTNTSHLTKYLHQWFWSQLLKTALDNFETCPNNK